MEFKLGSSRSISDPSRILEGPLFGRVDTLTPTSLDPTAFAVLLSLDLVLVVAFAMLRIENRQVRKFGRYHR